MELSIIIVHYRNFKVLSDCLNSIKKHPPQTSFEIIVVDNDEKKVIKSKLKRKFPQVNYLQNPANLGYAKANNLGAKSAKGKLLFILNPDTIILANSIDKLIKFIKSKKKVGAAAPLLVNQKNKPYPLQGTSQLTPLKAIFSLSFIYRLFPQNPIAKTYWLKWNNLTKTQKADVVPGSAFLIKKNLFDKIGQFDPNFFLYFEESDLAIRLKQKGYQSYILPASKIIHHWAATTPKSKKIKWHFNTSRFYYFKKHFGIIQALLVEFFTRLTFKTISLSLILLLAIWLRFYRLPDLMTFFGDQGRDYLAARDMLLTGTWPLVGIPSSVPWLYQGPVFIWLIALSLKLGHFNPVAPAILTSTIGVLTVYLTYKLSKTWLSSKASLLAGLFIATSPLAVIHSRLPYHISPIPLFSLLYIYSLFLLQKKSISVFWPMFLISLLFQFELTTAPLILLIPLVYFLNKTKPKLKVYLQAFLAALIPLLPKIIHDFQNGFKQTLGFIAWTGYRILSFFGFKGQHTVSVSSFKTVTFTISNYWQKFVSWESLPLSLILAIFIILSLSLRLKKIKQTPLKPKLIIILSFILINFIAFYLHQGPSEAYFPVLFPAWALIIAWSYDFFKKHSFATIGLVLISFYNLFYLNSHDFIPYGPTLKERFQLAKLISLKQGSLPFKLANHSSVKQFNSRLDNYRYLLWLLNTPESPQAQTTYTIYDDNLDKFIFPPATTTYHFENSLLIKHD